MAIEDILDTDQLKQAVNLFLDRLSPELKKAYDIDNKRDDIVDKLVSVMQHQTPDLNKSHLTNEEFLKKLTISFVTAMTLDKPLTNDKNKNLLEKFEDIFKFKNDPKLTPEEKQKKMDEALDKCCDEILKALKKAELVAPKPKPDGKTEESEIKAKEFMKKELYKYSNLDAVSSKGLPVVVGYVIANGLGFPDQNPHHGTAPRDRENDPNDAATFGGDPMNFNSSTISNFLKFIGGAVVDDYKKDLRGEKLTEDNMTPRPKGPGQIKT
jgi:hypothetical protein